MTINERLKVKKELLAAARLAGNQEQFNTLVNNVKQRHKKYFYGEDF